MKRLALLLFAATLAAAQGTPPAVSIGGSIGVMGGQSLTGQTNIVMANANYTMVPAEWWAGTLVVTSSVPLTAPRSIIAPANTGQSYCVQNKTTGGQAIQIIAASGTGVTVPNGSTSCTPVRFDGTNYVPASGDLSGFVQTNPSTSQTVTQPVGTHLSVNHLNSTNATVSGVIQDSVPSADTTAVKITADYSGTDTYTNAYGTKVTDDRPMTEELSKLASISAPWLTENGGDLSTLAKCIVAKSCTVVGLGNSILGSGGTGYENGVFYLLQKQLQDTFPDVTWNFQNLTLGGRGIQNAAAGYESIYVCPGPFPPACVTLDPSSKPYASYSYNPGYGYYLPPQDNLTVSFGYPFFGQEEYPWSGWDATPAQHWVEYGSGQNPDLLLVLFGMNDESTPTKTFIADLDTILAPYLALPNVPTITLITGANGSISPEGLAYFDQAKYANLSAIMNAQRTYAVEHNYAMIDGHRIFSVLRDGTDPALDYWELDQTAFNNFGSNWTMYAGSASDGTISPDGYTVSISASGDYMPMRLYSAQDGAIGAVWDTTDSNVVPRIQWRVPTDKSTRGYLAQITNNGDGTGTITVFDTTGSIASDPITALTSTTSFMVKAEGGEYRIWVNGKLVIGPNFPVSGDGFDYDTLAYGNFALGTTTKTIGTPYSSSITNVTIEPASPMTSCATPYTFLQSNKPCTPAVVSDEAMYGWDVDYGTNLRSLGGNKVNHPSIPGAAATYGIAMSKFLTNVKAAALSYAYVDDTNIAFKNQANTFTQPQTMPQVVLGDGSIAANTGYLIFKSEITGLSFTKHDGTLLGTVLNSDGILNWNFPIQSNTFIGRLYTHTSSDPAGIGWNTTYTQITNGTGGIQFVSNGGSLQGEITNTTGLFEWMGNFTSDGTVQATMLTDGTCSITGGVLTGCSGGGSGTVNSGTGIAYYNPAAGTAVSGANLTGLVYANGTSAPTVATASQVLTNIGTVPIANGGTNTTTQTTNGVCYYNGTGITCANPNTYDGTTFSIGSTSNSTTQLRVPKSTSMGAINYNAVIGDMVNYNLGSTGNVGATISSTNSNSNLLLGQDTTHAILFNWNYNATAANAYAVLETYGGNNVLDLNRSGGKVGVGYSNANIGNLTSCIALFCVNGTSLFSGNGVASTPALSLTGTWFTGGTSTTTKPQLLIEPSGTTTNNWLTQGTGLGINAASGFSGSLIDAQLNGTRQFQVSANGSVTMSSNAFISNGNWQINSAGGATLPSVSSTDMYNSGIYRSPNNNTIASASTIAPTSSMVIISGTTTIDTITPPSGFSSTSGGCIDILATGAWSTSTSGNIADVVSASAGVIYRACYFNTGTPKWVIK